MELTLGDSVSALKVLEPVECMNQEDESLFETAERAIISQLIMEYGHIDGAQLLIAKRAKTTPRVIQYALGKYKLRPKDIKKKEDDNEGR